MIDVHPSLQVIPTLPSAAPLQFTLSIHLWAFLLLVGHSIQDCYSIQDWAFLLSRSRLFSQQSLQLFYRRPLYLPIGLYSSVSEIGDRYVVFVWNRTCISGSNSSVHFGAPEDWVYPYSNQLRMEAPQVPFVRYCWYANSCAYTSKLLPCNRWCYFLFELNLQVTRILKRFVPKCRIF